MAWRTMILALAGLLVLVILLSAVVRSRRRAMAVVVILVLLLVGFSIRADSPAPVALGLFTALLSAVVWLFIQLFIWLAGRQGGLNRRGGAGTPSALPCPSLARLKAYFEGHAPLGELHDLAAHLDICERCQNRLEGLAAGNDSWSGMARRLSRKPPAPDPVLKHVMEKMKEE